MPVSLKSKHVPRVTIQRMAVYVRELERLNTRGELVVSSDLLAAMCSVSGSQVRKDLACLGEFGVRGVGYRVEGLLSSLKEALGVARTWNVAIVGMGNLGRALLRSRQLKGRGFDIVGAFDCDPFKIGEMVGGTEVLCTRKLKDKAGELGIEVGLVTTPPERAQRAANYLIGAGVKGLVNFTGARISAPPDVHVEYADFLSHFFSVAFGVAMRDHKSSLERVE